MLYPVLQVVMLPLAAVLLDLLGVGFLLIGQGVLSLAAAFTESFIRMQETNRIKQESYSFKSWAKDVQEGIQYIKKEKGLHSIYEYMTVSNGVFQGTSPILIAFFRTAPGFTAAMYSLFSVVEFIGRTIGSALQYRIKIPNKKKFGFVFFVYQFYDTMDMCLLWLPYPFMLVNRTFCGFLGSNSAIMRSAATQRYIPPNLRSRVNAFSEVLLTAGGAVFALLFGLLGEVLDYRLCFTIGGTICLFASWIFIFGRRNAVRKIYETAE
jgi:MFS family permease